MTDDNLLEEKCSCGASIKVVLPTSIGGSTERKELLQRLDDWRLCHVQCRPAFACTGKPEPVERIEIGP